MIDFDKGDFLKLALDAGDFRLFEILRELESSNDLVFRFKQAFDSNNVPAQLYFANNGDYLAKIMKTAIQADQDDVFSFALSLHKAFDHSLSDNVLFNLAIEFERPNMVSHILSDGRMCPTEDYCATSRLALRLHRMNRNQNTLSIMMQLAADPRLIADRIKSYLQNNEVQNLSVVFTRHPEVKVNALKTEAFTALTKSIQQNKYKMFHIIMNKWLRDSVGDLDNITDRIFEYGDFLTLKVFISCLEKNNCLDSDMKAQILMKWAQKLKGADISKILSIEGFNLDEETKVKLTRACTSSPSITTLNTLLMDDRLEFLFHKMRDYYDLLIEGEREDSDIGLPEGQPCASPIIMSSPRSDVEDLSSDSLDADTSRPRQINKPS